MQVTLTPHAEELVKEQIARGLGRSPEDVIERALQLVGTLPDQERTGDESQRRRQAVHAMQEFMQQSEFRLGPGESIRDLLHEGHQY